MNKDQLIAAVSDHQGFTIGNTKGIINALIEIVGETLQAGQSVDVHGFGSFKAVTKDARVGRNPATGEKIDIPAKTVVKFTPAKALRDVVNS